VSGEASPQRSSVVVGGGFAGFFAAGILEHLLAREAADLTFMSATDHLCYSPLLPEVIASQLDPRRIAVPLRAGLGRTRVVQARERAVRREARAVPRWVIVDARPCCRVPCYGPVVRGVSTPALGHGICRAILLSRRVE